MVGARVLRLYFQTDVSPTLVVEETYRPAENLPSVAVALIRWQDGEAVDERARRCGEDLEAAQWNIIAEREEKPLGGIRQLAGDALALVGLIAREAQRGDMRDGVQIMRGSRAQGE